MQLTWVLRLLWGLGYLKKREDIYINAKPLVGLHGRWGPLLSVSLPLHNAAHSSILLSIMPLSVDRYLQFEQQVARRNTAVLLSLMILVESEMEVIVHDNASGGAEPDVTQTAV